MERTCLANAETIRYMKSLFKLIRWQNLLFIILIVWLMEKMVACAILDAAFFGEQLSSWMLTLLTISVVFIAAGGYAINDYFDVKIDVINRPDKLIVTRELSKQQAMLCHQVMTGIGAICGLLLAVWLRSWSLGIVFIFVPGLLWFYSSSYKRQFIVGNLIVSLATALVPLIVAMANVAILYKRFGADVMRFSDVPYQLYAWLGGFAAFAFLTTLCREIIKDLQDQVGDRELECHTLPIKLGETWTKIIVITILIAVLILGAVAVFQWMPFGKTWQAVSVRYYVFGLLLPILCNIYMIIAARISSDYKAAQHLMKFIMLIGVLFSIVIRINL